MILSEDLYTSFATSLWDRLPNLTYLRSCDVQQHPDAESTLTTLHAKRRILALHRVGLNLFHYIYDARGDLMPMYTHHATMNDRYKFYHHFFLNYISTVK